MSKICTREEAISRRDEQRRIGKVVGYTSGVFDLLHPGHVDYLTKARASCDFLIVGLNADESVRENKGSLRPVCTAKDRALVLASLSAVDAVFIFTERNNNKNIELLKPDLYIKAGDYSPHTLTSAPIVEKYGGKVLIIPTLEGYSTSRLIERIGAIGGEAYSIPIPSYERKPAAFLDRDGTIIEHVEYLHEPSKLKVFPGALEAIKKLREGGFRIVVVTNQPGIGLGYFTKEDFFKVNRELLRAAAKAGVPIDRVYFCPHSEADGCRCRKPGTAMIERAVQELNVDLEKSFMVGDMTLDVMLGKNAGCRTIQVLTGVGGQDKRFEVTPDHTTSSLAEAAEIILASKQNQ